jgi:putative hydrolase of the HAD superfamily
LEAVIFDLDGTLLNRNASLIKFIDDQYERYKSELRLVDKEYYKNRFIELDCRGYVRKDRVYKQLLQELKITALAAEDLMEDYITNFKHSCVPFPNLHDVLDKLQRMEIKLGLISNGKGQFQLDNLIEMGIHDYFDTILISESVGLRKPDPRIFQKGLENLSVSAENSIFVGDHPEADVQAARNAGMIGVWKRDDYWGYAEADFIIDELRELLVIIEGGVNRYGRF